MSDAKVPILHIMSPTLSPWAVLLHIWLSGTSLYCCLTPRKPAKNPDTCFDQVLLKQIAASGRHPPAESPSGRVYLSKDSVGRSTPYLLCVHCTGGDLVSVNLGAVCSQTPPAPSSSPCDFEQCCYDKRGDACKKGRWARGRRLRLASAVIQDKQIRGQVLRDNEQMPTGSSQHQAAGPNEKPTCWELGAGSSS